LERRPGWGGGKLNATTLALPPLDDEQTALLIAELLDRPLLAVEDQQVLLERAGGNPLYAEQFADLFVERGSTDELSLPETLQGIIAARVDGLPGAEKNLLQDAAVVGKVFWASSLQGEPDDVRANLHALERKGFVRRQRRSSVEGQQELAFAHALVRDVSYGQIARPDRAAKHRHVADWIESLGRPEDHAEMLAYHWRSALELTRAAGAESAELAARTRSVLRDAGDRAAALNAFSAAGAYYAEALELWPNDDPERPDLLFRHAEALYACADAGRDAALEEARDALLAAEDDERAAEVEAYLSRTAWYAGRRDIAQAHVERAEELLAGTGPSIAKARVLSFSARLRFLGGDSDEAIRIAREALLLAEEFELAELQIHALTTIGSTKNRLALSGGHEELERALALGVAADSPLVPTIVNNLAVEATMSGDLGRAGELYSEGLRAAERFGDSDTVRFARGNLLFQGFFTGRWREVYADADRFIEECAVAPHYMEGAALLVHGHIAVARGEHARALTDFDRALVLAREIRDPQRLLPALFQTAWCYALLGRESEARALATEGLEQTRGHPHLAEYAGQIASVAGRLGLREDVREIVARSASETIWQRAALAAVDADFVRAADMFAEAGAVGLEAEERLTAAEELIGSGLVSEGIEQLERALAFFRSVGAAFYLEQGEALRAAAQRASA
jgi:tetratricopeptide (TPR) repeat protein